MIELHPVTSSNIQAVGYAAETRTLAVQFVTTGDIWHYEGVPPEAYEGMMNSPSIGRAFDQNIKPFYPGTLQD